MSVEVVFAVWGWFPGFQHCLESIRRFTPNAKITVLGDEETAQHIECLPIGDFMAGANAFASVYKHNSPNPAPFELKCFQRWFVLAEFARSRNLTEFWSFDWDVLVFTDLAAENLRVGMSTPLHVFYCRKLNWLETWLEQITEAYRFENCAYSQWVANWQRGNWLTVCDMYIAYHTLPHLDAMSVSGLSHWDHNLATDDGAFEVGPQGKTLTWADGKPYARHSSGSWVRLNCLHCWGVHKGKLGEYLATAAL